MREYHTLVQTCCLEVLQGISESDYRIFRIEYIALVQLPYPGIQQAELFWVSDTVCNRFRFFIGLHSPFAVSALRKHCSLHHQSTCEFAVGAFSSVVVSSLGHCHVSGNGQSAFIPGLTHQESVVGSVTAPQR